MILQRLLLQNNVPFFVCRDSIATLNTIHHEYIFNIQETGGAKSPFAGNGMSRTAMIFKIATIAGHKLTVPEMNKFKEVNPRSLERVYNEVVRVGDAGNALFALRLILKN